MISRVTKINNSREKKKRKILQIAAVPFCKEQYARWLNLIRNTNYIIPQFVEFSDKKKFIFYDQKLDLLSKLIS